MLARASQPSSLLCGTMTARPSLVSVMAPKPPKSSVTQQPRIDGSEALIGADHPPEGSRTT